jgi:exodeoxyribonuclease-3
MKIATWNVNSVRARIPNVLTFLEKYNPDILLLQELKCLENQFPLYEFQELGYRIEVFGEKGRNGVAILSKFSLEEIKKEKQDGSRYIEASFCYDKKYFKVASIYVPNGGPKVNENENDILNTESFKTKMLFFDNLKIKFSESIKNNEFTFFCGDYNVCPNLLLDVYSPKKDGSIANTEQERQKFKECLAIGMHDVWRDFNQNLQEYSWWGYRGQIFEKNQGYRIDAILTSTETKKLIKNCYICKEIRAQEKASDHVPMICEV